jgi:acid phosphatase
MFRPFVAAVIEPLEGRTLYAAAALPRPDHVVVVIEENRSHQAIIGDPRAAYLNALAAQGASFTDYHAITHPSQPNYIALFSGSTQGVEDNLIHWDRVTAPSLGGQLIAAGLDFAGYSEDLPYAGYAWPSYRYYHRRHNPWVNFADVPFSDNLPFRSFPRPGRYDRLPTVSFVVPNLLNDMHDDTVERADAWLRAKLDPYAQWARTHNSLLVVTWDEDDDNEANRIPTIVVGAGVKPGHYPTTYDHYSLLRTIEDMYGLAPLGAAAAAAPIAHIWEPPADKPARLSAAADTFVWDAQPAVSFGASKLLDVRTDLKPGQTREAFFKFDVGGISPDETASVKLRFYGALNSYGRVAVDVFSVADTGWSEKATTWDSRPKIGTLLGGTVAASTFGGWYEVDVTDYVKGRRAAGDSLLSLGMHNKQLSSSRLRIHSREADEFRPELVVVRT